MLSMNWITSLKRVWIMVGVLVSAALMCTLSACPRDVDTKAHSCFTSYSFHFQNMQSSHQKLCCGLDVEILRAFCQSYTSAMACVNKLKQECPEDVKLSIDKTLNNVNGVQAELHELCSDDSFIENYAMYQSCFTTAGGQSELCLRTHLNNSASSNIRFLSKVSIRGIDQFCKSMRNTVECVQKNIRMVCGDEPAEMADILIKPMVRQSADCDYSVINNQQKTTKRPYHSHHAYISDDHDNVKSKSNRNERNSSSSLKTMLLLVIFVPSFVAVLIISKIHC